MTMDIEDIEIPCVIIALIVLAFACMFSFYFVVNLMDLQACNQLEQISTLEHHWDIWNGCLVRGPNGYWYMPEDFPYQEIDLK
jgi:hypothetical protein